MAARRRDPRRGARQDNRRLVKVVAGGIATLLIAGSAGALGSALSGGSKDKSPPTTEPPKLTGAAKELVELLGKRDDATYHARYTGQSPEAESVALETWQRKPLARQDSQVQAQGQVVRTATLMLEASQVQCTRIGDTPWTCQSRPGVDPSLTDPLGEIRSRLGEGTVTASDAQIDGVAVRCFRFAIEATTNELCLRADNGIPVTVASGPSKLTLVELETEFDDSAFTPPAEPTA